MPVDPRYLVDRLTETATRYLEAGVARALDRGHAEVRPEHLVGVMLGEPDTDASRIADELALDPRALRTWVDSRLEGRPRHRRGWPLLGADLMTWLSDAWLLASLVLGHTRLRSGALFVAWLRSLPEGSGSHSPPFHWDRSLSVPDYFPRSLADTEEHHEVASPSGGEPNSADSANPRPSSVTALDRFTMDLTELARRGALDPVFGRDREIEQAIHALARRRKNNVLLVGEPGVGKTALVEGLALSAAEGRLPRSLRGASIHAVDLALLQAGSAVRGELETRLAGLLEEARSSAHPTILFFDEGHALIGSGGAPGGADMATLLKPALARGEVRVIAATTWAEYKKHFRQDPALDRRFQVVQVNEPAPDDAVAMLRAAAPLYGEAHGVRILDAAIEASVRLSHRYVQGRQLPDKSIDVLDSAAVRVKLAVEREGPGGGSPEGQATLDVLAVAETVSDWTGVPVATIQRSRSQALIDLGERLPERVVGQRCAQQRIMEILQVAHSGLAERERPSAVLLFAGPSGVGKSETAAVIADELFGGNLVRIQLSELQERHSVARLIGAPPGYVGYGEGGVLTEAVRRRPYSVVLLDECEKGDPEVLNLFYQAFDKGWLDDAEGRPVDFRNTLIILTTNLAATEIARAGEGASVTVDDLVQAATPVIRRHLPAPLLHRMAVVPFVQLDDDSVGRLVGRAVDDLVARVREAEVTLAVDSAVVQDLSARCVRDGGARAARQLVERSLHGPVVRAMEEHGGGQPLALRASLGPGSIRVRPQPAEAKEPSPASAIHAAR